MIAMQNSTRMHIASLMVMGLLVSACVAPSPQALSQSKPEPRVVMQGTTSGIEVVQSFEINNCDGKANAERTESRSRSVETTISTELAAALGASVEVISTEIQATVGAAEKWGSTQEMTFHVTAPPGTRMAIQLAWIGNEEIGIVQNFRGSDIPIAFRSFSPTDVRIKSQIDIGCPITPTAPLPLQNTPTIGAPALSVPTAVPAEAGQVAVEQGMAPIRQHFGVATGSGLFANGTFSDGLAPYSEQWLWDNGHFRIQRMRREEQPNGCDVSRYNTDAIWIGAGTGMSIMINGEAVGDYTAADDPHGYIYRWPIKMGDQICVVNFERIGYLVVIGPDVYYHYDSYCYRGNC